MQVSVQTTDEGGSVVYWITHSWFWSTKLPVYYFDVCRQVNHVSM